MPGRNQWSSPNNELRHTKKVTIMLTAADLECLDILRRRDGLSRSSLVRKLLALHYPP